MEKNFKYTNSDPFSFIVFNPNRVIYFHLYRTESTGQGFHTCLTRHELFTLSYLSTTVYLGKCLFYPYQGLFSQLFHFARCLSPSKIFRFSFFFNVSTTCFYSPSKSWSLYSSDETESAHIVFTGYLCTQTGWISILGILDLEAVCCENVTIVASWSVTLSLLLCSSNAILEGIFKWWSSVEMTLMRLG